VLLDFLFEARSRKTYIRAVHAGVKKLASFTSLCHRISSAFFLQALLVRSVVLKQRAHVNGRLVDIEQVREAVQCSNSSKLNSRALELNKVVPLLAEFRLIVEIPCVDAPLSSKLVVKRHPMQITQSMFWIDTVIDQSKRLYNPTRLKTPCTVLFQVNDKCYIFGRFGCRRILGSSLRRLPPGPAGR
jgi:hypothetical protein